jgi:hypothetical protein
MSENQTGNTPASAVLHVDPTVGDGMVGIPGGDMLLVADYVREGPDLILVGPEGQTVVVDNYFSMANPPALTTAGGARVPGDLVKNWRALSRLVNMPNRGTNRANPSVRSRQSTVPVKSFGLTAPRKSWKPAFPSIKAIRSSRRTAPQPA